MIEAQERLDILVNNAGITVDNTVVKMTDEDWANVMAVNPRGMHAGLRSVLRVNLLDAKWTCSQTTERARGGQRACKSGEAL